MDIPNSELKSGKVYLVGAGPGSPDFLTVKAQQLLSQAEVLIYDGLIHPQLLELVPVYCLKIAVGKRGGQPSTPQAEINQLIVKYCQQHKQVVRLKSGDPFIFGRARLEILALQQAQCDFELIPGISSALAAPLLAGIPLTDKILSSCFTVLTGHEPEKLDWQALARLDTLVILMGGRNLGKIVKYLGNQGRSLQCPVAVIRNSSQSDQYIWQGNLGNILDLTAGENLSPTVIVIGEVVSLSKEIEERELGAFRDEIVKDKCS